MALPRFSYRLGRTLGTLSLPRHAASHPAAARTVPTTAAGTSCRHWKRSAFFHSSTAHPGSNDGGVPNEPPPTDFGQMDVLGGTPAPSTAIDVCMSNGFQLNSGTKILDGSGVLLVGGAAFSWRPWGRTSRLVNDKGQWEVDSPRAFGLLDLVWPRPDLLILGLGPTMRPLSPSTKRYIASLGMRVEVLDTRNAAAQFNLLATERGVADVAAALIPIGWEEGTGA